MKNLANRMAINYGIDLIFKDLLDRRGIKNEMQELDPAIRGEIRKSWYHIIKKIITEIEGKNG